MTVREDLWGTVGIQLVEGLNLWIPDLVLRPVRDDKLGRRLPYAAR